ncbi:uncharacterized protein PAN0_002d1226 [Moesziomyces antarcticus]|uniref:Uncharacterized protein n=1 Tax=Pseudozyma antarctica TaxID=84753 RepID=A0A5C3FIB8_PSEA2|nr:uncharacterized protein PAN0_002d1226 [Moesziomyces antarcticus]GAK63024.1 conserved hypothetical protein [Moesziomyces antarcticus]SPO43495.1 uncharacterized protein PSANT_01180 [Moesziomyces antarcticus]
MASPVPHTNTARAPLAELPLHQFVSQSLAGSPTSNSEKLLKTPSRSRSRSPSLSRSRRGSLSVSPHKQAVLQNHRLVREGSVASPSSSSNPSEPMADTDVSLRPRRLFEASGQAGLDLEASPALAAATFAGSRFSPRNVGNLVHHSPGRPSTPKGASTTPLNTRHHRPPHTSGPKPAKFVEPSPTTQRMSEPRPPATRRRDQDAAAATSTPSRTRTHQLSAAAETQTGMAATGATTPLEDPMQAASSAVLQSLPKKKHRVSRTEVAIAHEEAGAGPIASPSPRKMTDYFSPSQAESGDSVSGLALSRPRADSITLDAAAVASLPSLAELSAKASANGSALAQSGLFLGVVARPLPGWTVYEDPSPDTLASEDTAPSQDHGASSAASSPMSSPARNVPSTPNKENRRPDAGLLASMVVPMALPERAYSVDILPAKTGAASRKRGTGGRLSLLADAEDGDAAKELLQQGGEDGDSAVVGSGKKPKSRGHTGTPASGIRKASAHQRKASAGSRKASSTHGVDAAVSVDAVASRTRSRTRA